MSVLVSLSSGEQFYVDAEFTQALHALRRRTTGGLVMVGNRAVNPLQVTQVQYVREVPTIHVPEQLEEKD